MLLMKNAVKEEWLRLGACGGFTGFSQGQP